jgi:two-component system, NtrC family, response regulator AtoC
METIRLLIVEDNPVDVLSFKDALRQAKGRNFAISHVETLAESRECLGNGDFDVIVLDLGLPDSLGLGTFLQVRSLAPDLPIVVVSGLDDESVAIEAVKSGAQDYLIKDKWGDFMLSRSISYAIERHRLISEWKRSQDSLRQSEERFRAIFEATQDAVWVKDRSLTFTHLNPAMAKVFARPPHELVGTRSEDLFGADAATHIREVDLRVLSGESIEEQRTLPFNGVDMTWNTVKVPLRNAEGAIVGLCGIARDITDWQRQSRHKGDLTYKSKAMQSTLMSARMAGGKGSTILLLGESGSGKDYLARFIHENSDRSDGPYFSINCAAISAELAESELFGHEKGAFTGAVSRKRGLLELAEGGTILLNEIGDLPLPLQAKLLTFLDTRKFNRVGGEKEITANARLIAATNKDLSREVELGSFRKDLFYRINVMSITVPPLRERVEDIPILVEEILSQLQADLQFATPPTIDAATMEMLKKYNWPGNVRELRNVLERGVMLSDPGAIDLKHLQLGAGTGSPKNEWSFTTSFPFGGTLQDVTDDLTRSLLAEALRISNGNKKKAAQTLGIARDSLYRHMKKFGMETGD